MTGEGETAMSRTKQLLTATTALRLLAWHPAAAQDNPAPPAPAAAAPAATPPEAAASPAPAAPAFPPYSGPLSANASPFGFDSPLGHVVVSGAVTGLAIFTQHPIPGDNESRADISNGQVFVQTTTGKVQFAVQAGIYSLPSLGTPYLKATRATDLIYGPVPQAFIRIVPTAEFTITAGLIPTLYGAEYTFTFQNQNIARGLLWNQEPAISRGVQLSYAKGKLALNVSVNDGFYSDKLNWLVGSAAYSFDPNHTLAIVAGGNLDKTESFRFQSPTAQNNGELYNIIYTWKKDGWTVNPYVQYARTHVIPSIGLTQRAESIGGALLVNKAFKNGFSLAARGEYEKNWGHHDQFPGGVFVPQTPNLIGYGVRSDAWSATVTPGYQKGPLFLRVDLSYTGIGNTDPGLSFGRNFDRGDQLRGLIEGGILF